MGSLFAATRLRPSPWARMVLYWPGVVAPPPVRWVGIGTSSTLVCAAFSPLFVKDQRALLDFICAAEFLSFEV